MKATPCTVGGHRSWFFYGSCGRRVAVLYGAGRLFACRPCKGLGYASQSESDDDRAARRADWIRKRLGWAPGSLNEQGSRRPDMLWRTYERLVAQHDADMVVSHEGIARQLGCCIG